MRGFTLASVTQCDTDLEADPCHCLRKTSSSIINLFLFFEIDNKLNNVTDFYTRRDVNSSVLMSDYLIVLILSYISAH